MTSTAMPAAITEIERATLRRITARILSFLIVAYFVIFVEQVNAGFAALPMNHDIGLSAAQRGLVGLLLYVTYALCEVPSNLAVERFAARISKAQIMITKGWGSYPLGLLPPVVLSGAGCLLVLGLGQGRAPAARPSWI
ncbi:hypothetical protein [Methylobacterium sp. PvR107]|uniref:hypothetical protein n=1 Tax=Methylobacterium sp. PvR107 TaxID=2806597 RepID=UPI001AE9D6A5|nr:hypothetical protein [Methylobacterium sp. PvR107]MBP1179642.1 sugar phosphate permease [Methylobacterium sp. PvR107]